jgi:hypothetical protein
MRPGDKVIVFVGTSRKDKVQLSLSLTKYYAMKTYGSVDV